MNMIYVDVIIKYKTIKVVLQEILLGIGASADTYKVSRRINALGNSTPRSDIQ